jgi:hypothetical protein
MRQADRRDPRVMDGPARDPPGQGQRLDAGEIVAGFADEGEAVERLKRTQLIEGQAGRRRGAEDPRMGDGGEEFMRAGPGYGLLANARGEHLEG